jgi:vacuolar protein sorting-associated protein 13A/C
MVHPQSKRKSQVSMERGFREAIVATKLVYLFVLNLVFNCSTFPLAYRLVEIEPLHGSKTDHFFLSRVIKDAKRASNHPFHRIQKSKESVHKFVQTLEVLEDLGGMQVMISP